MVVQYLRRFAVMPSLFLVQWFAQCSVVVGLATETFADFDVGRFLKQMFPSCSLKKLFTATAYKVFNIISVNSLVVHTVCLVYAKLML